MDVDLHDHVPTGDDLAAFERDGFLIVRQCFSREEVAAIRDRFVAMDEAGQAVDGHWHPDFRSTDPLKRYPRVMHPHRFDELSMRMMLHPRVGRVLAGLMGEPAVACQSMYYFKPPGSAGQSLHQDNFYLAVQPGTCIAAWTAIDPAHKDNGGLYVVPGSHALEIICPDPEAFAKTRSTNLVDPPKGMKAVPTDLAPGDTLFFGGSLIHGSGRNRTRDQWRRSFICHYMPASSAEVNEAYAPIHDFEGNVIEYGAAPTGGPCGYQEGAPAPYNTYGVDATVH